MNKYGEIIGLPVISISQGKRIGTVKDLIFCPKTRQVKAFLLGRKGCDVFKRLLLFKDVLNVSKDAIIVNDGFCMVRLDQVKEREELDEHIKIKGLRVYAKSGNDLGIVQDVLFDHKTGLIEGVEVSAGLLQDIVEGRNILPLFGKVEFGEENILVDKEAMEEMTSTGGGLKKRILGNDKSSKDV